MKSNDAAPAVANDDVRLNAANDTSIGIVKGGNGRRLREMPTIYMTLEGVAASKEAEDVVTLLCHNLTTARFLRGKRDAESAVAAILADCLRSARSTPYKPLCRPMSMESFKGQRVPYWSARYVIEAMEERNLLIREGGSYDRETGQGTLTRLFPTTDLIESLADIGITPANSRGHFGTVAEPLPDLEPILCNKAKVRNGNRMPKGASIAVDYTNHKVADYAEQVRRINAFTAKARFDGMEFVQFQRAFNLGDDKKFDWNKGGRLWDLRGQFQFLTEDERKSIRINGMTTIERDIGSSHLVIFLKLIDYPFDPQIDLYEIDGFDRNVVKRFANLMVSEPRIPKGWPSSIKSKFLKKCEYPIDRDHTFQEVRDACFDKYPVLRDRHLIDITWADLQFIESEAVICAVDVLNREHNVVALPVHDSLIVPIQAEQVASVVLADCFERFVGVRPIIK